MAPLWEAFASKAISDGDVETTPKYRNCRHELLAVGLAYGYTMITGKPQIVFLPTGLGVLNGSMGLRLALQDRCPMLVLSPHTLTYGTDKSCDPGSEWPSLLLDVHGPAEYGHLSTKWSHDVKIPHEFLPELRRALYFADSIPRGPTLLQVPFEILKNQVPLSSETPFPGSVTRATQMDVRRIVDLLVGARSPLVITEHAARSTDSRARGQFVSFVEELGAPVFEFINPTSESFPRDHPLYCPTGVEAYLSEADIIVVAGSCAPWHPPDNGLLSPNCVVIVLEEDPLRPRAPFWGYRSDAALAGDICNNLELLSKEMKSRRQDSASRLTDEHVGLWTERNSRLREGMRKAVADKALDMAQNQMPSSVRPDYVHSSSLYATMQRLLPEGATIVDEVIASVPLMIQGMFSAVEAGGAKKNFVHVRGWSGGLGTGIPVALGCKLGLPSSTVCAFIGDGAFHYQPIPACFGFAQQYSVPILIVVCNNRGFCSQAWNIFHYYPAGSAVASNNFFGKDILPTPEFALMADAYGGHGEKVNKIEELEAAVLRCLAAMEEGKFAVLDVICEP